MFSAYCIVALVILSNIRVSFTLVPLPHVENNVILKTEDVIRSTVNTLFSSLALTKSPNPKLEQHTLLHNYFISLTLQDYHNLKEIAKLTRVNKTNIDNVTTNLIAIINKITRSYSNLNELTSFEVHAIDKEQKKTKLINAIYNDNVIDEIVLKILEDETHTNGLKKATLRNQSTTIQNNQYILDKKSIWRGHNAGRRLYNGKPTKIKHFGFMASVEIFNRFQCAGSIIKSDLVITAASCLQLAHNNRFFRENPPFLTVRVGSTYFEVGGEVIKVLEVYFYPSYDPKSLHHNIAIMRLHRRLRFHKKAVKKIEIDEADNSLPYNIGRITIVGWGAKTASNSMHNPWKSKLRYADINVYDLRDCQDIYSKEYVTSKNFCAGYISRGSGACNRDVGGPGIAHGKLVGIISFGAPVCGTPDAPTVFVKVGFYYDWIEEIMEQDVPYIKQKTTLKPTTYTYGTPNTHDYGFHLSPITNKKQESLVRVDTHASSYKMITSPQNKSIRDFLKTMFNDDEIKEFIGGSLSLRNINKTDTTRKVTEYVYDMPYIETTTRREPNSFNTISREQSQYIKHTKMDNFSVTNPKTWKLTTGIVDYGGEYSEYSGLQIGKSNLNKSEDTLTHTVTKNVNSSSIVTQFVVPLTNIPKQLTNATSKEIQDIVLEYFDKPNIFSSETTASFPKEQLQLSTQFGIQSLNMRERETNLSITSKEATKFLEEQYKDTEIYKDIYPILTDNESQNETLRLLLKDYIMKFIDQKDALNTNRPLMLVSVKSSSQNLNNGIITKADTQKGTDEPTYQYLFDTTDKTNADRPQGLSSSSSFRERNIIYLGNKNRVAAPSSLTQTTKKYLSEKTGKFKANSPKGRTYLPFYEEYFEYSTLKYNEEGFGLPHTILHFPTSQKIVKLKNTSSNKSNVTNVSNPRGRSTPTIFREFNSFSTKYNNEDRSGLQPTELYFQTLQKHFSITTDQYDNMEVEVPKSSFVGTFKRIKHKMTTLEKIVHKVELSNYLSKDDIANVVHKKKNATGTTNALRSTYISSSKENTQNHKTLRSTTAKEKTRRTRNHKTSRSLKSSASRSPSRYLTHNDASLYIRSPRKLVIE